MRRSCGRSRAQCWNAINGAFGDDLRKRCLDKGFVLTGWTDLGFRSMTNNKHPINSAKDMQNLKMRVPNSKAYIAMMQAMGAATVAVDLSELYLALRQGVADGQDTPPSVVKSNKYYEVQKYVEQDRSHPHHRVHGDQSEVLRRAVAGREEGVQRRLRQRQRVPAQLHGEGRVGGLRIPQGPGHAGEPHARRRVVPRRVRVGHRQNPDLFVPELVKMARATPA